MPLGNFFSKFLNNSNTHEITHEIPTELESFDDIPVTREIIDLIENRILLAHNSTLILCSNGTIQSTTVLDDKYGTYDGGLSQATTWRNISSVTLFDGIDSHIVGADYSGKIHITPNRKHQIDDDTLVGSYITSWNNVKTVDSSVLRLLAIRNDGDVYIYEGSPRRGVESYKLSDVHNVSEILIDAPRRVYKHFDGSLFVPKSSDGKTNFDFFEEANNWNGIKKIFYASGRTIGLREDGTLIASRYAGNEIAASLMELYKKGILDNPPKPAHDFWDEIKYWENMIDIKDYGNCVVGISGDGEIFITTIATDQESINSCIDLGQIREWYGIAKIYVGFGMVIGLKFDGSIVCTKCPTDDSTYFPGKNSIDQWTDIIALKIGVRRTVGVKRNGTLVAVGDNPHGEINVENMRMFRSISELTH